MAVRPSVSPRAASIAAINSAFRILARPLILHALQQQVMTKGALYHQYPDTGRRHKHKKTSPLQTLMQLPLLETTLKHDKAQYGASPITHDANSRSSASVFRRRTHRWSHLRRLISASYARRASISATSLFKSRRLFHVKGIPPQLKCCIEFKLASGCVWKAWLVLVLGWSSSLGRCSRCRWRGKVPVRWATTKARPDRAASETTPTIVCFKADCWGRAWAAILRARMAFIIWRGGHRLGGSKPATRAAPGLQIASCISDGNNE